MVPTAHRERQWLLPLLLIGALASTSAACGDDAPSGPSVSLDDEDVGFDVMNNNAVGNNDDDNGSWAQYWAFACCGSNRPLDKSCPGDELQNGLCLIDVHDTEDATFFDAARACTGQGADVCSKSQMQALRNAGMFFGQSWTNDGADNDNTRVGGILGSQPDNPNPSNDRFGYACCL